MLPRSVLSLSCVECFRWGGGGGGERERERDLLLQLVGTSYTGSHDATTSKFCGSVVS